MLNEVTVGAAGKLESVVKLPDEILVGELDPPIDVAVTANELYVAE
jgi:hypothetical protein